MLEHPRVFGGVMPAVRSSMRKIKDVLRLKYEAKLSCRQIAASLKLSVGVISKYTKAAEAAGLSWPLPVELNDRELEAKLFPTVTVNREFALPDCAYLHQQLKRKGVTLMTLWTALWEYPCVSNPTANLKLNRENHQLLDIPACKAKGEYSFQFLLTELTSPNNQLWN